MMRRMHGWPWALTVLTACAVPDLSTLGPFSCEDSTSCAEGYVCVAGRCAPPGTAPEPAPEPDPGVAPTLQVAVPAPPPPAASVGETTYTERDVAGTALPPAWRRDQAVAVELRTDASLPLTLGLRGTDGQTVPVETTAFSEGCDTRQCVRASLPLWKPRFNTARGSLTVVATARSASGRETRFEQALPVTRWKWSNVLFEASDDENSLDAAPGIGSKGTVYVTTYDTQLNALSPEGLVAQAWAMRGEGAPVVGRAADGRELLYVRNWEWGSGHSLSVFDAATSQQLGRCPEFASGQLDIDNAVLAEQDGLEGVLALTAGNASGKLLGLTAGRSGGGAACQVLEQDFKPSRRGNTVLRGGVLYYSGPTSWPHALESSNATLRPGWPVRSASNRGVNGLAVAGELLVLGEGRLVEPSTVGGLSTVPVTGGATPVARYVGGPVSVPTVGAGGVIFGVDSRLGQLVRVPLSGGGAALTSQDTGLDSGLGPTLGQGGLVYAMRPGEVGVWSAVDLSPQWKWSPHGTRTESLAPPVLDCTRDALGVPIPGRPGVLYAAIHNELHALVVDSAGLDADAPWPKQHHDERNTGSATQPILRCP